MIRLRPLAALALSAALASATAACAQTAVGDEVIRTARVDAPARAAASVAPPVVLPTTAETFDAVSATLDAAAEAWSSGDVEAVMATYVSDEPLLVLLGDTPLKGPEAVRAELRARAERAGGLGAMRYEWFETMQFDVNTAVVSGRVVLTRDGRDHRALFTRVLRRTADGWRIVHDQLAWGVDA